MLENSLKVRIDDLEIELEKKDVQIMSYLEKIDELENKIIRLEALTSDNVSNKKKKKTSNDPRLVDMLEAREKDIRELKDRLGFLRKDKTQLQQQVETLSKSGDSSIIRIEQKKTPLDSLISELQTKIHKQNTTIESLKKQLTGSNEFNDYVKRHEEITENLKEKILEKNKQIEKLNSTPELTGNSIINKKLTEDLQKNLKKARAQITTLREKLGFYEKIETKDGGSEPTLTIELKTPVIAEQFKTMPNKIGELKKLVSELYEHNGKLRNEITGLKARFNKQ